MKLFGLDNGAQVQLLDVRDIQDYASRVISASEYTRQYVAIEDRDTSNVTWFSDWHSTQVESIDGKKCFIVLMLEAKADGVLTKKNQQVYQDLLIASESMAAAFKEANGLKKGDTWALPVRSW